MTRRISVWVGLAAVVTLVTLGVWIVTDLHFYTKFEVVETLEREIDPDDPLAGTGFYDSDTVETTVARPEFHLGLFPTPSGVLDKHAFSVVSILAPIWALILSAWVFRRWNARSEFLTSSMASRKKT